MNYDKINRLKQMNTICFDYQSLDIVDILEKDKQKITNEIQKVKDSYLKMQQEYNWKPIKQRISRMKQIKKYVLGIFFLMYSFSVLQGQIYIHDVVQDTSTINRRDEHGRQGLWYFYDKSTGIVSDKFDSFINDLLDGCNEFYSDSVVIERRYYKYGLLDSIYCDGWSNGQCKIEARFENGLPNGELKIYSYYGDLKARIIHKYGKIDFSQSYFNENYTIDTSYEGLKLIFYYWPKLDTVKRQYKSKFNKEYWIFYNGNLYKHLVFYKDKLFGEAFYLEDKKIKRNIYSTKKPYLIEKIYYLTMGGKLYKSEYYNKNGDLCSVMYHLAQRKLSKNQKKRYEYIEKY